MFCCTIKDVLLHHQGQKGGTPSQARGGQKGVLLFYYYYYYYYNFLFYTLARIPPARHSTRRMEDSRYESLVRLGVDGVSPGTPGGIFLGPSRGHFCSLGWSFWELFGSFWEPWGVIGRLLGRLGPEKSYIPPTLIILVAL